jgi:hypothetical protein
MDSVSNPSLPTRTVVASIMRSGDLVALGLALAASLQFAGTVLGVQNRILLVLFSVAWVRPAVGSVTRFRRGRLQPRRLDVGRIRVAGWVAAVPATCVFLSLLKLVRPAAPIWHVLALPLWAQIVAVAVLMAMPALLSVRWHTVEAAPDANIGRGLGWRWQAAACVAFFGGAVIRAINAAGFVPPHLG